jgi:hypothetical protein
VLVCDKREVRVSVERERGEAGEAERLRKQGRRQTGMTLHTHKHTHTHTHKHTHDRQTARHTHTQTHEHTHKLRHCARVDLMSQAHYEGGFAKGRLQTRYMTFNVLPYVQTKTRVARVRRRG